MPAAQGWGEGRFRSRKFQDGGIRAFWFGQESVVLWVGGAVLDVAFFKEAVCWLLCLRREHPSVR